MLVSPGDIEFTEGERERERGRGAEREGERGRVGERGDGGVIPVPVNKKRSSGEEYPC